MAGVKAPSNYWNVEMINSISNSMMIPRRLGGGDEAWFDKLTMTDYEL